MHRINLCRDPKAALTPAAAADREVTAKYSLHFPGDKNLGMSRHLPYIRRVRVPPGLAGMDVGMILRLEIKHQTRLFPDLLISMVFIHFLFHWHAPEGL